jgi:hypothetical protein
MEFYRDHYYFTLANIGDSILKIKGFIENIINMVTWSNRVIILPET